MSGTDVDAPSMSGTESTRNPFNFQSVTYQPGRPKQNVMRLPLYVEHTLINVGYW
jgi:hypothetical protein